MPGQNKFAMDYLDILLPKRPAGRDVDFKLS